MPSAPLRDWTVDYGDGPKPVQIPHAWGQDVPVDWEGPAIYRATVEVQEYRYLRFTGISYHAEVFLDGESVREHTGIWDAFDIELDAHEGKTMTLEVHVTRNGGDRFPTPSVLSGFLPYVYNPFGGIFRPAHLTNSPISEAQPATEIAVEDGVITFRGQPHSPRGVLHWGWYPDLGHPHPDETRIRSEIRAIRSLGFNHVKFCLWLPPHIYLEILDEFGMTGWLELPLWAPEGVDYEAALAEMERIVRQYRRHPNILAWTIGCELSNDTSAEWRERAVKRVRELTGAPLVRDNSGSAEMYGGDPREFATFQDFHPYCDLPFYPAVLDSLLPGVRESQPILLGEFNDYDVHRDLPRISREQPYWASSDPYLNAKGVRWQYDLPHVTQHSRFATAPTESDHARVLEGSRSKALFVRKWVTEQVAARPAIKGWVLTGLRDTPISSSGVLDDWGQPRFEPYEVASWNAPEVLFLIPSRRPPWINGGNRAAFRDPQNHFDDPIRLEIGLNSETGGRFRVEWEIIDTHGTSVLSGVGNAHQLEPGSATSMATVFWETPEPGEYTLTAHCGAARNAWPLWILERPEFDGWVTDDPAKLLSGFGLREEGEGLGVIATRFRPERKPKIQFLTDDATIPVPFWRECAFDYRGSEFWARVPFQDRFERLLMVSPDRAIDIDALAKHWGRDYEVLMNRVDTRSYQELPLIVRYGETLVTTLRPFGGLGIQPPGLVYNPAGAGLLRSLLG